MAVHQPALLLGIDPGGLEPGDAADLVLFDLAQPASQGAPPKFEVRATLVAGEVVFGSP
jgi:cytosine/adenosine deaminase-related metal-dependent hydrolase